MIYENQDQEAKDRWFTGSGQEIDFLEICQKAAKLSSKRAKVFIGSDSDISRRKITFCKAICIYGSGQRGIYFFSKNRIEVKKFPSLLSRITEETRISMELAELLATEHNIPLYKIEVHLDVSPLERGTKTSKFADMLKGYVTGAGYSCKVKPDAWASQTVADKHSK